MEKIVLPLSRSQTSSSKNNIIISSRVCIARNIDALTFPEKLSIEEKILIENQFSTLLHDLYTDQIVSTDIKTLESVNKFQLMSDLNITNHFLESGHTFFAKKDGKWILLPNEYDHLRVFSIEFGQHLKEIYKNINSLLLSLDSHIHFAYTPEFGFATSDINYAGNGLYLSLLLNLTGLELQGSIPSLIKTCEETGYKLSPYTSHPNSGLFLLQNTGSFGISELDHIDHIIQFTQIIQSSELLAKKEILADNENIELFVSQINQLLAQDLLSYAEMSYIISLVDFLDKSIYSIRDKTLWLEQLFRLQNYSSIFSHISNFEEFNNYRALLIKHIFAQQVQLK